MSLSQEQQRLVSMLDYLEEWDKLNRVPTFDVSSHQGGLLAWQSDVADLPGVHLNAADASGEVWLEIERLRPMKPPAPSEKLLPWIVQKDDPGVLPEHRESLPNPEDPAKPLIFDELPDLQYVFNSFVNGAWAKWSETEKPRRKSIGFYDKLFNLLQTIETEGAETALELVWGIGVAIWEKHGKRIRYPLLSRLVEIDPITTDMALRVRPRELSPMLETDVYVALEVPGLPAFEKAARSILDHPDINLTPFDESSFEQILAGAAGTLDRHARYWPRENDYEQGKLPIASPALTITDTWVLFARRKGTNFLIEDIRRLRAVVESEPVPEGAPKILVEDPTGAVPERVPHSWRGVSTAGYDTDNAQGIRELYFPKPFNSEQVQIIDRLENAGGVVVQGPPGTGKTHTIANVICHYLAEGKRVLVTSKGESALAVLRSQLPAPIQSLTVSLLTSEREGLKQLEQGVSKITSEITNLNKQDVRKEIERCQHRIDQLHQQITGVDRELADWAKKNINPAPPSLDELRPAELARHVLDAQQTYGWFPDDLDGRPEHEIQFNLTDVEKLREARIHVGSDLIYLGKTLPKTDTLPTAAEIGDLHRSLLELESVSDEIDERRVPRFRVITSQHLNAAAQARDLLIDAINVRRRLSEKWTNWLCENYAAGDAFQPVFAMVCQIAGELGGLVEARRQFLGVAINWSDEWDNDEELYIAVRNAAMNRSPFGLLPFGKKSAREKYQQIRLNGKIPDNPEDWRWIESHVSLRRQSRTIAYRWNSLCAECPAPELPTEPSHALRSTEMLLAQMNEARRWVLELAPAVAQEITNIFAELQADGIADDPDKMETLATAISIRLKRHQLENARQEALRLKNLFDKEDLPAFKQGLSFTEHMLGRGRYETVIVENAWQGIIDEFERLHSLNESFSTILYITEQISKCGALRWATHLQKVPHVEGEQDWTPENWTLAWKWSRQSGYLRGIDGRERVQSLASQRLTLQNDLSSSYTRLIEHLTWLKLRETLDQDRGLMAALQQYMAAIRGIGTGTGIRAVRYRQDARRAMTKANKAIRCWIMPHWRVSESLPSELALFDLVIIDEASQSDLWALPAMLRAKKLLIVGDNKQVSPSAIGVRESDIRQLHARFLRTLPFGDVLSPEKSVYDLASVLFASDLIRLREHFRCVEPIIQFSNRLSYNNEIKCLRIPTASERITPPLVDVFVRGGYRDGRSVKINRVEARAIVDEIKYLSSTPSFENRTIGVVSLLGSDQPKHIFEMLISELGEEKILRHQIRCGDAMTFQGREADIVFISMVSDGDSVRALSGEMYEQRFNVAVSRAKDRLYLYRSFCRDDLKDNDLRARLLDHFAAPLRRDPEKKGRERCESDFERAMFDRLTAAGYRVTPQVSAGGYRIDLVVEGHQGRRLAVECDGDQYHTPDVWMDDLRRQRTLERAGWNFWRCWGSSFLRDPDACMADLFKTLEQFQIKPIGAAEIDLTDIVEYREILEDTAEGDNTSKFVAEEDLSQKIRKSDIVPHESGFALGTNPNSKQSISDRVEVGDSVRYCAASDQDDEVFVTIVPYESNPNLGLINCNTAIAKALLGCRQNDEVDVALPHETKRLRVLQIQKHVRQGQP